MGVGAAPATLTLLGAGGAFSRRLGTTCALLRTGDENWLIDCGRQAPDQLTQAGLGWHDVHGQILTHVHGDHAYGLEDFAFSRYYLGDATGACSIQHGGPRPKLLTHDAVREELWEMLGPSLRYVPFLSASNAGTLDLYFDIVHPCRQMPPVQGWWPSAQAFETTTMQVVLEETEHVPGKPAMSVDVAFADGGRMWWSGDSCVNAEKLIALAPEVTVLFHDCTFVETPNQVHGAFSALRVLPEAVRCKMVLMHHEDDIEQHRDAIETCGFRLALPGDTFDLRTGAVSRAAA